MLNAQVGVITWFLEEKNGGKGDCTLMYGWVERKLKYVYFSLTEAKREQNAEKDSFLRVRIRTKKTMMKK